ncbi:MAG: type IV pilus biogenesis protein PilM [Thermoleophilaceae bacterium]
MIPSLPTHSRRRVVGLDLDSEYASAVQLSGARLERAAAVGLEPGLIEAGEVADSAGLSSALKSFFKRESLPKRVWIGVANEQVAVRHIELPRIEDADDLASAVRFQAAEAIPMPVDDVVLDHHVVGEREDADGTTRMKIVVAAVRRSMVLGFVEAIRGAGLKLEGVDLGAFALVRALAAPGSSRESAVLYCHLAGVTNLAVAVGGTCLFTRPLPRAAGDGLDADALADGMRLSMDYYMGLPDALPVGAVAVSGPGAQQDDLRARLAELTHMPVDLAPPLGSLEAGAAVYGERPYRYTVAAGLALGAAA